MAYHPAGPFSISRGPLRSWHSVLELPAVCQSHGLRFRPVTAVDGRMDRQRNQSTSSKPSVAGAALLLAFATLFSQATPARAGSGGRQVFLSTIADLRQLDPSVRDVGASILARPGARTGCGEAPSGELVVFYCPRDRSVYALRSAIELLEREFGGAGLRFVAAHEMAHGRQHAVTSHASEFIKSSVLDELQADCIAGTYLNRAYGYSVDSQDGRTAADFAYRAGDRAFYNRDWHGNPSMRVAALKRGLRQGEPARCLSSKLFNYNDLADRLGQSLRQWRGSQ